MNNKEFEEISKARNMFKINKVEEAIEVLENMAQKKSTYAIFELGKIYKEGVYVKKDLLKAENLLLLSGNLGYEKSFYILGQLYLEKKEYRNAKRSFEKNKSNPYSEYELGKLYYYGKGCSISHHKAFVLFLDSAKNGCVLASYMIGYQYYYGDGIRMNKEKGKLYLIKAIRKRVPDYFNIYNRIQTNC